MVLTTGRCPYRYFLLPILLLINIFRRRFRLVLVRGVIAAVISGGTAIITALGTKEVDTAISQQNEEKAGIKDVCSKAVAQNDD